MNTINTNSSKECCRQVDFCKNQNSETLNSTTGNRCDNALQSNSVNSAPTNYSTDDTGLSATTEENAIAEKVDIPGKSDNNFARLFVALFQKLIDLLSGLFASLQDTLPQTASDNSDMLSGDDDGARPTESQPTVIIGTDENDTVNVDNAGSNNIVNTLGGDDIINIGKPLIEDDSEVTTPVHNLVDEETTSLTESQAMQQIYDNFTDYDTDGDGFLSKQELQAVIDAAGPDAGAAQTLLDNFDAAIFGNIDPGSMAWAGVSKDDISALKEGVDRGKILEAAIWDRAFVVAKEREVIDGSEDLETGKAAVINYVEDTQDSMGVQDD